jgi:predicted MFS family arabinose efflux permease
MQDVGSTWLMATLSPSPVLVALMQTASSLPFFLLALPAGALADVTNRRRLLLATQGWMMAAAATLGALSLAGAIQPGTLLAVTFILGLGAAMNAPAWQAITPELVPRAELPAAVALGGVGFNVARAAGPALGGLVVAAAGPGAVFLLNAASFLGVMVVLYRWERPPRETTLQAERALGAVRAGMRYVRHAPQLRAVLVRTGLFIVSASAMWALLPLIARREMGLSSLGYGALLGSLGLGAVAGAGVLPRLRQRLAADLLLGGATLLLAAVSATLAVVRDFGLLCLVMLAGGAAWMAVMSSFNVLAQTAVPSWVRARALSIYLLVSQGGMAAGAAVWGGVAARFGTPAALLGAAAGLALGLGSILRYRLSGHEELDLTPSMHLAAPLVVEEPEPEHGPVLVIVEYRIDPAQANEFLRAMRHVARIRRRDGAYRWGIFVDVADPQRYLETSVVESWVEHLRQHERVTVADRAVIERARSFHTGEGGPVVSHYVYARENPE